MDDRSQHNSQHTATEWADEVLSEPMARRRFLVRAAAVSLTATSAPALLAACAQIDAPTAEATATSFPTPTPFRSDAVTPIPTPTIPRPTATPVPAPVATATPTATPAPPPPALDTEATKISHLLRRAGFGASKAELAGYREQGLQKTIDQLVDFGDIDNSALEDRLGEQEFDPEKLGHLHRWWMQRMAYTARPLEEKITLFWHGILTSSIRKVNGSPAMFNQNHLFRTMGMGRYDEMLKAVSRDPAMLIYLDSRTNKKKAPNENYSRELMELFTLGLGNYTEDDVRESARAFTGWQIKGQTEFIFNERQHDYEVKVFLGQAGNWDGDDAVDIIMQQPVAAEYITTRLWTFFAYADPEPEVITRLSKVFRDNNTEIRPVMRAIFESDEFYSQRATQALVKGPAELAASTIRMLGLDTNAAPLKRGTEAMGQVLFAPPDVSGWEGGATWINSSTLLERINLANSIANGQSSRLSFDPTELWDDSNRDPQEQVDFFVDLLLGGQIAHATRAALVDHVTKLGIPTREQLLVFSVKERLRSLVYLILASPDYQLA